jgi:hypothetical protein
MTRILRGTLGSLLDFSVRRRKKVNAVRHTRKPKQAGAFRKTHQLPRQISARLT